MNHEYYDDPEIIDLDAPAVPGDGYYYEEGPEGGDYYDAPGDDYYDDAYDRPVKERRGGGILSVLIPLVLGVIILVSGTLFLRDFLQYKRASDEYSSLNSYIGVPEEKPASAQAQGTVEVLAPTEAPADYPPLEINYAELKAINSDFVGVIYVPALSLRYPVAASHDDVEYLDRTFEKNANPSGCIFLDCYASRDLSDLHSIIYGHNMKNGTMFGSLKRLYADPSLCEADPYFYMYTEQGVYKYEIFSYHVTGVDSYIYEGFRGEDGYAQYMNRLITDSQYSAGRKVDFSEMPKTVTLSTCHGTEHTQNFVVHGVLLGIFN